MRRILFSPSVLVFFATIFCLACLAGCAVSDDKAGQFEDSQDVYVHTVEWPGETLPMIAQWYTGSKENWKILSQTNPKLASRQLAVNDQILIPIALVKNSQKMPEEFLATFSEKKRASQRKSSSQTKQGSGKKEEFQPYGPK